MSKFLFLHKNNEPEDLKVLDVLGSVLLFRDGFLKSTFSEVFEKYDVVVLDIDNKLYKDWFAAYKNAILNSAVIKTVFLYHPHVHIDDAHMKILKDEWKINSVIKNIPSEFKDKADLVAKLVNNSHLPSLDMPEVESCIKSAFLAIGKKIGCVSADH